MNAPTTLKSRRTNRSRRGLAESASGASYPAAKRGERPICEARGAQKQRARPKKATYQFQLRLGVHRTRSTRPAAEPSNREGPLRFAARDALQQPFDFSVSKPDVVYQLKPRAKFRPQPKANTP